MIGCAEDISMAQRTMDAHGNMGQLVFFLFRNEFPSPYGARSIKSSASIMLGFSSLRSQVKQHKFLYLTKKGATDKLARLKISSIVFDVYTFIVAECSLLKCRAWMLLYCIVLYCWGRWHMREKKSYERWMDGWMLL